MTIPDGYRVALVAPDATIIDNIDLDGYDLTKPIAAADLAGRLDRAVARHAAGGS